jgi:hypothetical protein
MTDIFPSVQKCLDGAAYCDGRAAAAADEDAKATFLDLACSWRELARHVARLARDKSRDGKPSFHECSDSSSRL